MKKDKLFLSLIMIFSLISYGSFACRYTVREIGFSEIGSKHYHLFFLTNSHTQEEQVLTINKFSNLLLRDSNIRLELINVDEKGSSSGLEYITRHNIQTFPSVVFVAPDGESIRCPYTMAGQSLSASSWFLMETLATSTFREDLIRKLIQSYGVVLIIEGADDAETIRVKNDAREAIKKIAGSLNQMPKVVNKPPEIMVIPRSKIEDEKILLFGLGITEKNKDDTHVAILYGRGRLAGPVLTGEQINTRRICNLLTFVGADCECGIDNSWIIGEMIPLRWGPSEQAELIEQLGFDVENPFVKTEMSQIISMKPSVMNPINPLEENLLGFMETSFEIENGTDAVPRITAAEIQKSLLGKSKRSNLVLTKTLVSLGSVFLVIVMIGLYIFLLNKRRAKRK
jgi:hypothetical protein